jgi:hypothetical protein
MALIATPGGTTSNSYCTVAEASNYFGNSVGKTLWETTEFQDVSLIEATRLLDTLVTWNGYIASESQRLRWPRMWVPKPDVYPYVSATTDVGVGGPYLPNDVIPEPIKDIVCELAYSLISTGGFQMEENPVTLVRVGTLQVRFAEKVKSYGLPLMVRSMIAPWGSYSLESSNDVRQVGVVRV